MIINTRYYSPSDLQNLTDGELLDLIYYVIENYKGPAYHSLDVITELLTTAKGGN